MSERDIFDAALAIDDPDRRAAYLDQACAGTPGLREHILGLLEMDRRLGSFLETPAPGPAATLAQEPPGAAVGPYRLLQPLGEGGMGTVYLAEQRQPVQRQVALKVIRPGLGGGQVLARFEAERQALALMDHPNIARVLDAATTEGGQPYFVMELVRGVPITRYCDEHRLTLKERLGLFIPVCQAVQHAHQKGVIHRDLKPSNVLVALYDGKAMPKVIDFGVAKATGPRLTDKTLFTEFGQVVGTPEYMSPEQAELDQLDIDTRSDIYSLGVLLYELLTGTTPLAPKGLREAPLLEVLRRLREEEPPKPSARLGTAVDLPAIAARRGVEPRQLRGLVRGELDWIVMRCLEKDRNRRYETANGLARDLERYLHDEPVAAGPPGAGYRLRKFVRRHKAPVLAAALVLLSLVAGVAGVTWKWREADSLGGQARRAEAAAVQKTHDEEAAKEQAQQVSRELQKTLYEQAIALAHHEWQNGNPGRAEQLLADCRPEYRGWEWHYLHRLCHSDRLTLAAHADPLHHVAFSPDGRLIAAAAGWYEKEKPGEVMVWDAGTGKELFTLQGHTRLVRSVVFSPDGKLLASAGLDPAVRVWDVSTRRQTACYPGRGGWITCVAFSPDGTRLAAADGKWLRVWDVPAGQETVAVSTPSHNVRSIAFSPDGRQIAGGCAKPALVKLWDARTGKEIRTFEGHTAELSGVAFSPDGRRLASCGWDQKIKVWDVAGGKELYTIHRHSDVVTQVSFSPDGRFVASASWDGTVRLWQGGGAEAGTFRGHTGQVNSLAFSPDGERLASAGSDHQVRVWDVMTEQEGRRLHVPGAHPYGLAFSADGKLLAAADGNIYVDPRKAVAVYDTRTGLRVGTLAGHAGRVTGVAFSPCGPQVASSSTDHTVKVWDAATGRLLHTLRGHAGDVTGVAFSRDGRRLASSSADRTVRVWDTETGQECRVLHGHTGAVTGVAFAPDGRIASSSADRTVRLWDPADDAQCLVLTGHTDAVNGVAFAPDGRQLASASADQTLRVWDAAGGQPVFVLRGHTEEVWSLAYSPRGDRLASASRDDGTVRLWDANTGRQLLALRQNQVLSVAFSPDGYRLASGTAHNELIQVWDAAPPRPDDLWRAASWFGYYAGQRRWDRADNAQARLKQQLPGDAALRLGIGHVYADVGLRDRAIVPFSEAIRVRPDDVLPWRARAQAFAALERWDEAFADYAEALKRQPDDAGLWRERADWFVRRGRWDRAADDYSRVVELTPDDADGWSRRGLAHGQLGLHEKARADYTKAIELKPEEPSYWSHRGWASIELGQPDKALADFAKVLELRPDDAWWWDTRGRAHSRLGQYDKAVADHAKAIELKPGEPFPWYARGSAYARLGQHDKAVADFARALELRPDQASWWLASGLSHSALNQLDKAVADYTRALELKPDDASYWSARGVAHVRLGQKEKALADHTKAVELKPTEPSYWYNRGSAYAQLGQRDKAIADYSKALELKPDYALAWSSRGNCFAELGQWDRAQADLSRATERAAPMLFPWHRSALARLATWDVEGYRQTCAAALQHLGPDARPGDVDWVVWACVLSAGAVKDADVLVRRAEQAVAADPKNGVYLSTLGAALYRAGRFGEAIRRFGEAAAVRKESKWQPRPEVYDWFFLAMAHHRQGESAEARRWLGRAVQALPAAGGDGGEKAGAGPWDRRLTLQMLHDEAECLLGPQPGPADKP
jgi:WD40 repeat protein/tetratricopeptide (TPR) repeat protein/serine/threonine protein kinase